MNASGPIGPYISGPISHDVNQGPYATPNPSGLLTPGGLPLAEQQHSGSSRMAPIQQQASRDEEDEDEDEEEEEEEEGYEGNADGHNVTATSGSGSEPYSSNRRRQ